MKSLLYFPRYFFSSSATLIVALVLVALTALPSQGRTQPAALTITGRISDTGGTPLPGVFITEKDAPVNATTNAAGDFLLASEHLNPILVFKCAGYQTQTVALKVAGPVAITMHEIGVAATPPAEGLETVNELLNTAEEQPLFPGGVAAYRTYLQQNVHYPEEAKAKDLSGSVFVSFVVDEDGRILDAEVAKGVGSGLDEEAVRLVRLMPWWTPGRVAGQPVRVPVTLRIRFEMQTKP